MAGYRSTDPIGSRLAWSRIRPMMSKELGAVLDVFERHPEGLTDVELHSIRRAEQRAAGEKPAKKSVSTFRSRRKDLEAIIRPTGRVVDGDKVHRHFRFQRWHLSTGRNIPDSLRDSVSRLVGGVVTEADRARFQAHARKYSRRSFEAWLKQAHAVALSDPAGKKFNAFRTLLMRLGRKSEVETFRRMVAEIEQHQKLCAELSELSIRIGSRKNSELDKPITGQELGIYVGQLIDRLWADTLSPHDMRAILQAQPKTTQLTLHLR